MVLVVYVYIITFTFHVDLITMVIRWFALSIMLSIIVSITIYNGYYEVSRMLESSHSRYMMFTLKAELLSCRV